MKVWKGNILSAAGPERLEILEGGYLVFDAEGVIQFVGPELPSRYAALPLEDWGDRLILQSFADMHLHAPQYPMVGIGMDLPLLTGSSATPSPTRPASPTRTSPGRPAASLPRS